MHSVNKGATYRCKSLQILNTEAAVEVVTEQQLCVSLVAPGPQLNITVQTSCVKETDRQATSNQQLPPQANHMHTPCDGPQKQPGFLSLDLKRTGREKIHVSRIIFH